MIYLIVIVITIRRNAPVGPRARRLASYHASITNLDPLLDVADGMLMERYTGQRYTGIPQVGKIITIRPNLQWRGEGFNRVSCSVPTASRCDPRLGSQHAQPPVANLRAD